MQLVDRWKSQLRANLHNPDFWSQSEQASLLYVPTGAGFSGSAQMKLFCDAFPAAGHLFHPTQLSRLDNQLTTISTTCDPSLGQICEELVLNWTQQSPKLAWLLPPTSAQLAFPLRRYQLAFTIIARVNLESGLLENCRVYWDQASLLAQVEAFKQIFKPLMKPSVAAEVFESTCLPILSGREGVKRLTAELSASVMNPFAPLAMRRSTSLNSLTSILTDLPEQSELAVTPKMPARSRTVNPALLSTMRLGDDSDPEEEVKVKVAVDSPAPAHIRSVKSRTLFDETREEPLTYKPIMQPSGPRANASSAFDDASDFKPSLPVDPKKFESSIFKEEGSQSVGTPLKNMPQTNRVLFESRVFDGEDSSTQSSLAVGNAQPLPESQLLAPEEYLELGAVKGLSATLARPQMDGHFRGAQLGETSPGSSTEPLHPALSMRFNPNQSQINLVDGENEPSFPASNRTSLAASKSAYNLNRSQIVFDFDDPQPAPVKLSSRVNAPPGGHSTLEL